VFAIAPSFVLPYMVGYTDDVEKALFLRSKFGVPYWRVLQNAVMGAGLALWVRLFVRQNQFVMSGY
jgi:hypothetical protein